MADSEKTSENARWRSRTARAHPIFDICDLILRSNLLKFQILSPLLPINLWLDFEKMTHCPFKVEKVWIFLKSQLVYCIVRRSVYPLRVFIHPSKFIFNQSVPLKEIIGNQFVFSYRSRQLLATVPTSHFATAATTTSPFATSTSHIIFPWQS